MFANYPTAVNACLPILKFETVETNQPSEQALLSNVLQDIREKTARLIAERQKLIDDRVQLTQRLQDLEAKLEERDARLAELESTPQPQLTPVPSPDPVVGERIRALVEEIDACIALMPHARDMATAELLSA